MQLIKLGFTGTKSGSLQLNPRIWGKVSQADQAGLLKSIADNHPVSKPSGRNLLYVLDQPITTQGQPILALRVKGCCPEINTDGEILLHRGSGYVRHPLEINAQGELFFGEATIGQPIMGAFAATAKHEFLVARRLGPRLTDHAVGFGTFDQLVCDNEALGLTIFGQTQTKDIRYKQEDSTIHRDLSQVYQLGEKLASFHNYFIHRYPHLGNIGVLTNGQKAEIILRDLETCLSVSALTAPQRFGYLFLDIFKVIYEFDSFCRFEVDPPEPNAFLKGYFKVKLPFQFEEICSFIFDFKGKLDMIKRNQGKIPIPDYLQACPLVLAKFLNTQLTKAVGS